MRKVTVYGSVPCRDDTAVRELLSAHQIAYDYKDVRTNIPARIAFMKAIHPKPPNTPVVVINDVLIGGAPELRQHFEDRANIAAAR
jgi:glutaredoxin